MSRQETATRKRTSKIKSVVVHKVPVDNFDAKLGELAKIHAEIIKRRLNELNATPEQKLLILEGIAAKLKSA